MSERGKVKRAHRRGMGLSTRPGLTDETRIDRTFFERSYMPPLASARGPVRIYTYTGDYYGPVRVLNAAGECVRVISVEELRQRPAPKAPSDWVGAQETWNNRQRGVQKARVRAQGPPGDEISE